MYLSAIQKKQLVYKLPKFFSTKKNSVTGSNYQRTGTHINNSWQILNKFKLKYIRINCFLHLLENSSFNKYSFAIIQLRLGGCHPGQVYEVSKI